MFVAAELIAVVAHELGHLLACLAVGVKVKAFRLGDERYAIRFRVQTVQMSLGLPYKGRVEYDGPASVGRRAVITLAGSLVDLALAGLALMGWAMAGSGPAARPLAAAAALGFAVTGVAGLLPYRNRSGRLSDGARLFELRSDADTAELRAAQKGVGSIAVMLRRPGRIGELLDVHAGFGAPAGRHWRAQARSLHEVECNLLCVPGLPPEVIDEAAVRMRWLVDNYPFKAKEDSTLRSAMEHTLALARLRQGRFDEVEPLCASGLAADVGPDDRATLLATVVIARRALGRPHADLLAEAVALSPGADLVAEARSGSDEPLISQDGR